MAALVASPWERATTYALEWHRLVIIRPILNLELNNEPKLFVRKKGPCTVEMPCTALSSSVSRQMTV